MKALTKKTFLLIIAIVFLVSFASYNTVKAANQFDVLINEIAWMGTTNSPNDEWMELFNNTDNAINLLGWVLKSADGKLKIGLGGIIEAKGFYLLERTDDNSVSNISADLIYKGALTNSGADLKLYDSLGNLIDQANYLTKWPAGNNATKQTMERVGATAWQTSKSSNGTPRAKNSIKIIEEIVKSSTNQNALLPKQQKADSSKAGKTTAAIGSAVSLFSDKTDNKENKLSPWFLFLISLILIIISAAAVLFIKFTRLNSFFKKN